MIPFNHFGVKPRPRGWRRRLRLVLPLLPWLLVIFVVCWMIGSQCGCAVNESEVVPMPTTQPVGEIATPIATGQVATAVTFDRTVDHALGASWLVLLLFVVFLSHRREMRRLGK